MASVNNYAMTSISFSHDGTGGNSATHNPTIVYRAGATHVPTWTFSDGVTAVTKTPNVAAIGTSRDGSVEVVDWAISEFWATYNGMTAIDISLCPAIHTLKLTSNTGLTSLDVTKNPQLVTLTANICGFPTLDLSGMSALRTVYVTSGKLTQLGIDQMLSSLDAAQPAGGSGKVLQMATQTTNTKIDAGTPAATSAQSLTGKGWTITYSGSWVAA